MKKYLQNMTVQTLLAGVLAYALSAWLFGSVWKDTTVVHGIHQSTLLIKTIFLTALKMLVAPMIFFSLLEGMLQIGDQSKLSTLGKSTLIYYLGTTLIAIVIGLLVVFFIHPWESSQLQMMGTDIGQHFQAHTPHRLISQDQGSTLAILTQLMKRALDNPFHALANGNIIGIVCFSFALGLALIFMGDEAQQLKKLIHNLSQATFMMLSWILKILPLGVFAIVFDFQSKVQGDLVSELFYFALVVLLATLFHGLVILPLIAKIFGKVAFTDLFRKISKPMLLALTTSSSAATLPVSLETARNEFDVSEEVSAFVLPLGATMNMDGTALFEGIAAIFLAHIYGIDLSSTQVALVFFTAMISSIGAPGMPSGSMSGMQIVLLSVGIPLEAIGILLIVERPLDTIRTMVNVEGDLIGTLVVHQQSLNLK